MASLPKSIMIPVDEHHVKAVKSQILSTYIIWARWPKTNHLPANLRVLKPDVEHPIITSTFEKEKNPRLSVTGLWAASVWNDKKEILYTTHPVYEDWTTAMRALLRLTSAAVNVMLEKWDDQNSRGSTATFLGTEYA